MRAANRSKCHQDGAKETGVIKLTCGTVRVVPRPAGVSQLYSEHYGEPGAASDVFAEVLEPTWINEARQDERPGLLEVTEILSQVIQVAVAKCFIHSVK
jgi:hypothetical protein